MSTDINQERNDIRIITSIIDSSEKAKISSAVRYSYHIPTYQRGYRWTPEQAKRLIEDIYNNAKRYQDHLWGGLVDDDVRKNYGYCLQPLVLKKRKPEEGGADNCYNVIDGQQRLTTLAIIFCALNALDSEHSKRLTEDKISITYERSGNTLDIENFCKEIYNAIVKYYNDPDDGPLINNDPIEKREEISRIIAEEREKAKLLSNGEKDNKPLLSIDEQFIMEVYFYCCSHFRKANDPNNDYFYFRDNNLEGKDKIREFRRIFKDFTNVIWYEPKLDDEQKEFEKFNARKIALTQSELVKALFMNPDNYMSNPSPTQNKEAKKERQISIGSRTQNEEAIKERQISIGAQWDEIERQLHDVNFWNFFPHWEKRHRSIHFDAVIDFFVYKKKREIEEKTGSGESLETTRGRFRNDPRYSFNQLEEWISEELNNDHGSDDPYYKDKVMEKWWGDICDVFEWYHIIYTIHDLGSSRSGGKAFGVYHRVSLLQWLTVQHKIHIDKYSKGEGAYFAKLELGISIIKMFDNSPKSEILNKLNGMILEQIKMSFPNSAIKVFSAKPEITEKDVKDLCRYKSDEKKQTELGMDVALDRIIRSLVYSSKSDNFFPLIFLMIDSLYKLEEKGGSLSRFDFFNFETEKWVKEHIFAKGTNIVEYLEKKASKVNAVPADIKEDFLKQLSDCGWKEYLEFKFKDILPAPNTKTNAASYIDRLEQVKQKYLSEIDAVLNNKPYITSLEFEQQMDSVLGQLDFDDPYDADTLTQIDYTNKEKPVNYAAAVEFLKDNSMGNMALLTRSNNSSVGCDAYLDKQAIISKKINEGEFVPLNAVNVFSGEYCDPDFDNSFWYPRHRMIYLKNLINHIYQYLGIEPKYSL